LTKKEAVKLLDEIVHLFLSRDTDDDDVLSFYDEMENDKKSNKWQQKELYKNFKKATKEKLEKFLKEHLEEGGNFGKLLEQTEQIFKSENSKMILKGNNDRIRDMVLFRVILEIALALDKALIDVTRIEYNSLKQVFNFSNYY
jgi:uncharacterized protein YicC (UPF0701 family)